MLVSITIDGTAEEIAALAAELRERQGDVVGTKDLADAITQQLHRQAERAQVR